MRIGWGERFVFLRWRYAGGKDQIRVTCKVFHARERLDSDNRRAGHCEFAARNLFETETQGLDK